MNRIQAEPIGVVNSKTWDKKTRIFLGNCDRREQTQSLALKPSNLWTKESVFLDLIYMTPPSTIWNTLDGYKEFQFSLQQRPGILFGLARQGSKSGQKAVLYQMDGTTGKELQHFVLPSAIKKGYLSLSSVFYANAWRTFLAVSVVQEVQPSQANSTLLIFDVTETNKLLHPILNFKPDELPLDLSKAVFLRFEKSGFAIGVGGMLNNSGVLKIISLEGRFLPKQLTFETSPISYLSAIDLQGRAVVERIYCRDERSWWRVDVGTGAQLSAKKLIYPLQIFSSLTVIKNPHQSGLLLYFLGNYQQTKGLWSIEDPIMANDALKTNDTVNSRSLKLVQAGDYAALVATFGRLILIPHQNNTLPTVINIADHKPVPVSWKIILDEKNANADSLPPTSTLYADLLWDPVTQQEIVLNLNTSCQLSISSASINRQKYTRQSWRSIYKSRVEEE
jgi:hypothetical protein